MKRARSGLLTLVLLSVSSRPWAAPGHSYGFGSRATALGGAVAGDANDASALFYNPAGLALAPASELLLGYRGVSSALTTNGQDAGAPGLSSVDGAALGRGELFGVPVSFGLGLSLSNGHLSRVDSVRADEPRWVLRETLPELVDLAAGLALRPTSWLALGAGSGFLATTTGAFEVNGTAKLADGQGAEYDSQLRHAVDAQLLTKRYLLLGANLTLPPLAKESASPIAWSLGVSFRDEARLEQALNGTLQGNLDAGFAQIPVRYAFEAHSLVAFQPRQLVLGLSTARGPYRLNFDAGFEQWSRYPSPVARSAAHIQADVPAGLPLALPPNMELPAAESAGFTDRFTWRAGIERTLALSRVSTLALRLGYAYLPTPVPRSAETAQLMDASEHVFSVGAGVAVWQLAIDAHALYGHLPNRRLEREGDYFFAKGHTLSAGLTLTLFSRSPTGEP